MKFVIFHGSLGRNEDNWFPDLKTKLEYMGQTVYSPQFPIDDESKLSKEIPTENKQNLDSWLKTFEKEVLPEIQGDESVCFVGHSLANLLILHIIEKFELKIDCAIFVSPFLDKLKKVPDYLNEVNSTFYKTDFNFEQLREFIPVSYVLYSDTDPYVEPHRAKHFADVLKSSLIMVKKADHFSTSVNMHEFPLVYSLCVSRLGLGLYQKYAYKRQFEESLLNLISTDKKVMHMTPEQLAEEGQFHSENLSKGGFATFMSNYQSWDAYDKYFEGARDSARAGLDLSRVFIIKDIKDLERKALVEQMKLDFEAGIKIYMIYYKELEEIGCEKDFGIWDNEYVCIQHIDENGELIDGILDARVKSLLTAQNWRDRIIRKSKKIEKLSDIFEYKIEYKKI